MLALEKKFYAVIPCFVRKCAPLPLLTSSFIAWLVINGGIPTACAQENLDDSNNSATELAGHRYEAAGAYFAGRDHPLPTHSDEVNLNATAVGVPQAPPAIDVTTPVEVETPAPYRGIVKRNVFALRARSMFSRISASDAILPAKPDLMLIGTCSLGDIQYAIFKVVEPGKPPACFTLREGDQNEWVKILAVDAPHSRVNVRLMQPVMRIQNPGAEAIVTFESMRR